MDQPNDRTAPGQGSVPVDSPPVSGATLSNSAGEAQVKEVVRNPDAQALQGQPRDEDDETDRIGEDES